MKRRLQSLYKLEMLNKKHTDAHTDALALAHAHTHTHSQGVSVFAFIKFLITIKIHFLIKVFFSKTGLVSVTHF